MSKQCDMKKSIEHFNIFFLEVMSNQKYFSARNLSKGFCSGGLSSSGIEIFEDKFRLNLDIKQRKHAVDVSHHTTCEMFP